MCSLLIAHADRDRCTNQVEHSTFQARFHFVLPLTLVQVVGEF
jgi:hypothetical protein